MRYLGLALYSEGPVDDHFLRPVLHRLCDHICRSEGREPVDLSDVESLPDLPNVAQSPRHERILAAAKAHQGAWQVLFIHGDGEGNASSARQERVQPGVDAIRAQFGHKGFGVGVVPVRETESWGLCDGDALRSVLGTRLSDIQMGLPLGAHAIESTLDPKQALKHAFLATHPSGRRLRKGMSPHLNALGEQINLEKLRGLPSFAQLVDELRSVLRSLHVIA